MIGLKQVGIALLAVGVGLAAASGARITPSVSDEIVIETAATLAEDAVDEAHEAYCAAAEAAAVTPPAEDGCVAADAAETDDIEVSEDAQETLGLTSEEVYAITLVDHIEVLTALQGLGDGQPPEVAELREAWLEALEAQAEPRARYAAMDPTNPGDRLETWFGVNGAPFALGIVLIVIGALVARRDPSMRAAGDDEDEAGEAVDFGALLEQAHRQVLALATQLDELETATPSALDDVQRGIEAVQEDIGRMIASRAKVQQRFGLGGYAAILGPLSGGERRVNRSWSALVDLHVPEAHASLQIAATYLEAARDELARQVEARAAT